MEPSRTSRTGLVAAITGIVMLLLGLAIVFDLGPFAEEELSAADFIAEGDEICAQAHDEFLEIQGSSPRTAEEAAAQLEALIEVAEEERDSILDLGVPTSLAEDLDTYIAERERGIAVLEDGLAAAHEDDPSAYEEAQAELASQQAERHEAAQKLGFDECSKPLDD